MKATPVGLSIVVPALDEAAAMPGCASPPGSP